MAVTEGDKKDQRELAREIAKAQWWKEQKEVGLAIGLLSIAGIATLFAFWLKWWVGLGAGVALLVVGWNKKRNKALVLPVVGFTSYMMWVVVVPFFWDLFFSDPFSYAAAEAPLAAKIVISILGGIMGGAGYSELPTWSEAVSDRGPPNGQG